MTRYDLKKLNVEMSRLVPSHAEMKTLVEAFKETLRDSTRNEDPELLSSLCAGIGEVRLRGVCRRLSTVERAKIIERLLPDIEEESSQSQELIERLLNTAPNLIALHDTFDTIGFDRFRDGPASKWFGGRAALAEAVVHLRGFESLIDVERDPELAHGAIERIAEVLCHNAKVFEGNGETLWAPPAFNARLLLDAFNEQRWGVEDPAEFARAWNERIMIHTMTGLGIYDSSDLRLTSDELREIRQGFEKFPSYVITLENVVRRMDLCSPPPGHEGALGGYYLGRIYLFDAVRGARVGVDYPEGTVNAITYATVHEMAHAAQNVGMMDFQKISGWIRVTNLTFNDPQTNNPHEIGRESFVPGEYVDADSGRYVVSLYEDPEVIMFPNGFRIKNPYNATECGYLYREDARFVSYYASTCPEEDYAETLTAFLITPEKLKEIAPDKYEFMNFLYGSFSRS